MTTTSSAGVVAHHGSPPPRPKLLLRQRASMPKALEALSSKRGLGHSTLGPGVSKLSVRKVLVVGQKVGLEKGCSLTTGAPPWKPHGTSPQVQCPLHIIPFPLRSEAVLAVLVAVEPMSHGWRRIVLGNEPDTLERGTGHMHSYGRSHRPTHPVFESTEQCPNNGLQGEKVPRW